MGKRARRQEGYFRLSPFVWRIHLFLPMSELDLVFRGKVSDKRNTEIEDGCLLWSELPIGWDRQRRN